VNTRSTTKLLEAGIILAGFVLGTGFVLLTTGTRLPYGSELWFFDRIGGAVVYGISIGFLAILACQWGLRGRRDFLWSGEWLGAITAALLLSSAWLKCPAASGLGAQLFVFVFAHCLIQCLLSTVAAGLLFAKLFTRFRPGIHVRPPRTEIVGYLVCVITGPFVYGQFVVGMTFL